MESERGEFAESLQEQSTYELLFLINLLIKLEEHKFELRIRIRKQSGHYRHSFFITCDLSSYSLFFPSTGESVEFNGGWN